MPTFLPGPELYVALLNPSPLQPRSTISTASDSGTAAGAHLSLADDRLLRRTHMMAKNTVSISKTTVTSIPTSAPAMAGAELPPLPLLGADVANVDSHLITTTGEKHDN